MAKRRLMKVATRSLGFGLKEISNRVREIIKRVGTTSYKEISDEIVNEINEKNKTFISEVYDIFHISNNYTEFV